MVIVQTVQAPIEKTELLVIVKLSCWSIHTLCADGASPHWEDRTVSDSKVIMMVIVQTVQALIEKIELLPEPGIRRGNEDSRGNENQKSRKKNFSAEKLIDKHTFF